MGLVCGVDSSTQATKVELRDAGTGALVASARAPHPATYPPRSEQWPQEWWEAFSSAYAEVVSDRGRDVAAISIAAQQHGLVVVDAAGEVLRPAKLWNDTESAADARGLVDRLPGGAAAWAEACGSVPVAAFTISKLAWLWRREPDVAARVDRVLLPHDWLTWKLTGRAVTDRGDASGTGYWSPRDEKWRSDLLALVDPDVDWTARLPDVLGPVEVAGRHERAVVGPGTGDNMAAALSLALGPGDVVVSLGTSGTVYARSDEPAADPTGSVAGFADATGAFLPLVCTLNATKVTDAIGRVLGVDHGALDALALEAAPGAGGVVMVPYLDGERTPNRPDARGMISGLDSGVTREQLARAAFEGVVCGLLDGLDALRDAGVRTDGRIVLVGGGARARAYQRVLADLAARPVIVAGEPDHVAAGACVQAAAVLHGCTPGEIAAAWGLGAGTVIEPDLRVDAVAIRAVYANARGPLSSA